MVEKILETIINEMAPHLQQQQLEHLTNVLYMNFHGLEVQQQCTDIVPSGIDGDEMKVKMFLASKKAVNRHNTQEKFTEC